MMRSVVINQADVFERIILKLNMNVMQKREVCPMWGELHESKEIHLKLPALMNAGVANRVFRELGATLHYDVYSFEAAQHEEWQSETLLGIDLLHDGNSVAAQEDFNEIRAHYLFASRPSSDQSKVLQLVSDIGNSFNASVFYMSEPFTIESVQKDWDKCNDYLLKEWGEEPGSESLARMIHENYS